MSLSVPHHVYIKFSDLNKPKIFFSASHWRMNTSRVFAALNVAEDVSNYIPAAPILLPEGPWHQIPGGVTAAKGFKAAGMYGGLRAVGEKPDLALVTCDVDAISAGTFTTNVVAAAPVLYCKEALEKSATARVVLINAGQANAATGDAGYQDVIECAHALAELLQLNPDQVLIESTGVIGKRIKKEALLKSLPDLVNLLSSNVQGADSAAVAITTTDLVSKSVAIESETIRDMDSKELVPTFEFYSRFFPYGIPLEAALLQIHSGFVPNLPLPRPLFRLLVGGTRVRVGGMAKGSGMIHPNMATMLGVVTTDALVTSDVWRKMVRVAVNRSFNQITVDGDTSTNDCVIALASGLSGANKISSLNNSDAEHLQACLDAVMQGLAKSIAWDGEGATCLIEVKVSGAGTEAEAAKVARSVASSSLTKAAVYGRDPNWGRIACAAGYAGIPFNPNKLQISLGDILLMDNGQPLPFDRPAASNYLRTTGEKHGTVVIQISIGDGPGSGQAWGCDLSYDYVKINAEYTT